MGVLVRMRLNLFDVETSTEIAKLMVACMGRVAGVVGRALNTLHTAPPVEDRRQIEDLSH